MRVYGKEELGGKLMNEIIDEQIQYEQKFGEPAHYLELTGQELDILKTYLKKVTTAFSDDFGYVGKSYLLGMEIVIKD